MPFALLSSFGFFGLCAAGRSDNPERMPIPLGSFALHAQPIHSDSVMPSASACFLNASHQSAGCVRLRRLLLMGTPFLARFPTQPQCDPLACSSAIDQVPTVLRNYGRQTHTVSALAALQGIRRGSFAAPRQVCRIAQDGGIPVAGET